MNASDLVADCRLGCIVRRNIAGIRQRHKRVLDGGGAARNAHGRRRRCWRPFSGTWQGTLVNRNSNMACNRKAGRKSIGRLRSNAAKRAAHANSINSGWAALREAWLAGQCPTIITPRKPAQKFMSRRRKEGVATSPQHRTSRGDQLVA